MVKHVEAIMVALVYSFSSIADGFHITIKESLECKRAGVMEPMTESMKETYGTIVQCMSTTLPELKRPNISVR